MEIITKIAFREYSGTPPNDAATATEPAVCPAAAAMAVNPLAPMTGISACNVGARAVNPAAIAGAARPVKKIQPSTSADRVKISSRLISTGFNMSSPPEMAMSVPPVKAAAPMIPPRLHFCHLLLGDTHSRDFSSSFAAAIAEQATIISIASYNAKGVRCQTQIQHGKN